MPLIYPYLVTDAYPGTNDPALSRSLGHGVFVQIVEDHGGVVAPSGGSIDTGLPEAMDNLETALRSGVIDSRVFPTGPGRRPFAVFGGHWTASSLVILPSVASLLGPHLGNELVASVPHRDAMLVFPASDAASLSDARDFVREHEADGAHPLTYGLFALTAAGPHAVG